MAKRAAPPKAKRKGRQKAAPPKAKRPRGYPPARTAADIVRVERLVFLVHQYDEAIKAVLTAKRDGLSLDAQALLYYRIGFMEDELAHATRGWTHRYELVNRHRSEPETIAWYVEAFTRYLAARSRGEEVPDDVAEIVDDAPRDLNHAEWHRRILGDDWRRLVFRLDEPEEQRALINARWRPVNRELLAEALPKMRKREKDRTFREQAALVVGLLRGRGEGADAILSIVEAGPILPTSGDPK